MAGRYRGVTQRGNGWQISFALPNGTRCRETLRFPHTRKGEDEAQQFRARILHDIDCGKFDYAATFPRSKKAVSLSSNPAAHITIEQALKSYLVQAQQRLQRSTLKDYSHRIYAHLIPEFGQLKLSELSADQIRQWQARKSLSNKSINNILIPLKQVFQQAYEAEIVERNPLDRIGSLPVRAREANPFSTTEVAQIIAHLDTIEPVVASYYAFAFGTGLRTSELIALLWDDIDEIAQTARVDKAYVRNELKAPKTSAGIRTVKLQPLAQEALMRQKKLAAGATVFFDPRSQSPWRSDQATRKRYWYPALDALGITRRNPYQTRHTFASHLLMNGANPFYVANQLGHRDCGMVRKVYGRWIDEHSNG